MTIITRREASIVSSLCRSLSMELFVPVSWLETECAHGCIFSEITHEGWRIMTLFMENVVKDKYLGGKICLISTLSLLELKISWKNIHP